MRSAKWSRYRLQIAKTPLTVTGKQRQKASNDRYRQADTDGCGEGERRLLHRESDRERLRERRIETHRGRLGDGKRLIDRNRQRSRD